MLYKSDIHYHPHHLIKNVFISKAYKKIEKKLYPQVSTVRVVAWVFANIFRNKKLALNPDELKDSIATLKVLINYPDEEVNGKLI